MENDLAADIIARAREVADVETSVEATSVVTDDELLAHLNLGYRELYDLVSAEVGETLFGESVSVGPSAWAVPDDFYRELGIDFPSGAYGSTARNAAHFDFVDRNRGLLFPCTPSYRIRSGVIVWRGTAPTVAVTLNYIPMPTAIAADGGFDAFNGWDEYVMRYLVVFIRQKQEYDTSDAERMLARAEARVRRSALRIASYSDGVGDVRRTCDRAFYNG